MAERQSEALEKLNRGIQESRQEVQRRTMDLARDYFDDSAEELKQQIRENRSTLEGLPGQVLGGQEGAFREMVQELMDNYSHMEEAINEAQQNVAGMDADRLQGEIEATDAARREAEELGIDLTEVRGTGADGRIILPDVVEASEKRKAEGAGQEAPEASEGGAPEEAAEGVQEQAGQLAQGAQDTASGAADQAQQAAGQAADQAGQAAGQAQEQAGQVAQQAQEQVGQAGQAAGQAASQATQGVQDAVGGLSGNGQEGGGGPLGGATEQASRATDEAQDSAGGATERAGQAADGAQDVVGGVTEQAQDAAGGVADRAQHTVRFVPEEEEEQQQEGAEEPEEPNATNAAKRKARELGVDLSEVRGTGYGGLITIKDVVGS